MLTQLAIAILLVVLLFGLIWLSEKFISKFGSALAERFGNTERKKFLDFNNINNVCLIIAFVFFVVSLIPDVNRILFVVMAVAFALRSLRGGMSVFRALWLLIGSFLLGVVISRTGGGYIEPVVFYVLLLIGVPMFVLGFK